MIKLENVIFKYPKHAPIFQEMNLELASGHVYGLLGKNGEGKTTLMKLMSGLLFAQSGNIETLGHPAYSRNPNMLSDIYFLSEEMPSFPFTVDDFVKITAPFYPNFDIEQFNHYLAEFEISGLKQKMTKMSLGQKKKVLISFALAANTKIVFMDEPTNGLDIPSKSVFRKILISAADENRLFLISTHQVRDLHSLIDTILILDQGEMLLNAATDEITEKLQFKVVDSEEEAKGALYAEDTLRGIYTVSENRDHVASKLDMELLFNAVLSAKPQIKSIFNSK